MIRLMVLLLAVLLVSCGGVTEEAPAWHTCGNAKYNFWFDLPNGWRAEDASELGDGYFIECADSGADIRIYGTSKILPDEEFFRILIGETGQKLPFTFADGTGGTFLRKDTVRYFIRNADEARVVCYVSASAPWYRAHEATVLRMAGSVRFGEGK